jgi:hypothetical protein
MTLTPGTQVEIHFQPPKTISARHWESAARRLPFPYPNGKKANIFAKIIAKAGESAPAAKPSLTAMLNTPFHVPTRAPMGSAKGGDKKCPAIRAENPAPAFFHSHFRRQRGQEATKRELTSKALARVNHCLLTIRH